MIHRRKEKKSSCDHVFMPNRSSMVHRTQNSRKSSWHVTTSTATDAHHRKARKFSVAVEMACQLEKVSCKLACGHVFMQFSIVLIAKTLRPLIFHKKKIDFLRTHLRML